MFLNSNHICQSLRKTAWSPSYTLALAVHWVVTSSDAGRFESCVHVYVYVEKVVYTIMYCIMELFKKNNKCTYKTTKL